MNLDPETENCQGGGAWVVLLSASNIPEYSPIVAKIISLHGLHVEARPEMIVSREHEVFFKSLCRQGKKEQIDPHPSHEEQCNS